MNNEILDTVWNQIFDEDEAFYDLVANNEEKRLVGLMHFRGMSSPLRGKNVCFLDDFFVVPSESRGTGVEDEMFQKLTAESTDNG